MSLIGIFVFIIGGIVAVNFFGPEIGALFGFISANRNVELPQPKKALNAPIFKELPDATNNKELTIEGTSIPGATIKLFLNGPEKGEALVDGEGKFVFENINLISGRNTIFAKAIDEEGNESERSDTKVITVDTKEPKIEIEEPGNGSTVTNLDKRVTVKGSINEKAKVRINGKLAIQKPDLSFEYLLGVSEGDVAIKIEATDEAGNKKEEEIFIKYNKN